MAGRCGGASSNMNVSPNTSRTTSATFVRFSSREMRSRSAGPTSASRHKRTQNSQGCRGLSFKAGFSGAISSTHLISGAKPTALMS
jgi:hypothetical protein